LYTISSGSAIPAGADIAGVGATGIPDAAAELTGSGFAQVAGLSAGMIAVRAAGVSCPGGAAGAGALLAPGEPVTSGEMLVFAHPVTVAPTVMSRDGAVRARGWLPDHVRLGELERHLGEGVIEDLVAAGIAAGRMPAPQRQRLMSLGLAAGPLTGGDGDDDGPVLVLAGMPVCGIDGMLVSLADTPANRAMFGCTGSRSQKGPGAAPFPQLLAVVVTARAGRAKLGAITGAARAGEQTLLARLIRRRPDLFAGRRRRPPSAKTRPPLPARGTARPGRCCGRALRGWSSRSSGRG
jgi:hypothetical protein